MLEKIRHSSPHADYLIHQHFVNADKPVFVFFHGGPGTNTIAEQKYLAPKMMNFFNMLWIDQLGCYHSPARSTESITLDNTLDDLAGILRPYASRGLNLIGFCVGCQIVHYFREKYSELVEDVVLIGPTLNTGEIFQSLVQFHLDRGHLQLNEDIKTDVNKLMNISGNQFGVEQIIAFGNIVQNVSQWNDVYWHNKEAMRRYLAVCGENALAIDVFFRIQAELFSRPLPDLKKLYRNTKVLIMQGEHDQVALWDFNGKRVQELIPHASVQFISKAGHWAHLEESDQFVSAVKDFMVNF